MADLLLRPGTPEELAATEWSATDADMLVAEGRGYAIARRVAHDPDEWELLYIEVAAAYRGQGVGEALLRELILHRPGSWFLEVRASNSAALSLYRKLGFSEVGRRRDYYPSWAGTGREEGIVFTLRTC